MVKLDNLKKQKFKVSYRGYESGAIYSMIVEAKNAPEAATLVKDGSDDCFEIIQIRPYEQEEI